MYLLGNQDAAGIEMYVRTNGKLAFGVWREGGSGYEAVTSDISMQPNTDYYVIAMYDGKTSYLYINNKLVGTLETEGGKIKNPSGTVHMLIGANPSRNSNDKVVIDSPERRAKMKLYRAELYGSTNLYKEEETVNA